MIKRIALKFGINRILQKFYGAAHQHDSAKFKRLDEGYPREVMAAMVTIHPSNLDSSTIISLKSFLGMSCKIHINKIQGSGTNDKPHATGVDLAT